MPGQHSTNLVSGLSLKADEDKFGESINMAKFSKDFSEHDRLKVEDRDQGVKSMGIEEADQRNIAGPSASATAIPLPKQVEFSSSESLIQVHIQDGELEGARRPPKTKSWRRKLLGLRQ
ncbi:hypothetical protein BT96DRAFT_937006 [Gymnopus androsaceus JB14]|uniref:Uncharacterized protein n=1 Tax=Gymnopus androsaceus JB14 TaxID=1447944 RepID=A0A6A4HX20_9AGAR|nr:hypothetical protein BT96DRAFT_937006 [Gymnopus androsaceus JB14]